MLCFTYYTFSLVFTLLFGILAASSFRRRRLINTYMRLMSALFLAAIAFLVFLNAVTTDAPPRYDDDHQDARAFSGWLREKVEDAAFWNKVKGGLVESALCKDSHTGGSKGAKKRDRIYGSCCINCNHLSPSNVCPSWNRDPEKLCYGYELCKAAVLSQLNTKLSTAKQMITMTMC
ncbi:unnamed protein product [Linum trigynum]|uniref:Uncharacterized protein n=1 Tax=Linum trigynum TaxID=586398 RepID=A0AAV2GTS0_9ROSI